MAHPCPKPSGFGHTRVGSRVHAPLQASLDLCTAQGRQPSTHWQVGEQRTTEDSTHNNTWHRQRRQPPRCGRALYVSGVQPGPLSVGLQAVLLDPNIRCSSRFAWLRAPSCSFRRAQKDSPGSLVGGDARGVEESVDLFYRSR